MKKIICLVTVLGLILSCVGCGNKEKEVSAEEIKGFDCAVIRTSADKKEKTDIVYLDKDLNELAVQTIDYGNVGQTQFRRPIEKNGYIYESSEAYGYDKNPSKMLRFNSETGELKVYDFDTVGITDYEVDDKNVYTVTNLNSSSRVDICPIDGDKIRTIEFADKVIDNIAVVGNKLFYWQMVNGTHSSLCRMNLDDETIKSNVALVDMENEPTFEAYADGSVFYGIDHQLLEVKAENGETKYYDLPESKNKAFAMYGNEDKIYIASNDVHGENNDTDIVVFDVKKRAVEKTYKLGETIMQFYVKDSKLYVLDHDDNLMIFEMDENGTCKKIKSKEMESEYEEYISSMFFNCAGR